MSKTQHEHKWTIVSHHWQCETCGMTYR